jgi:NAD-dependent SIR2 family protein deacetylase
LDDARVLTDFVERHRRLFVLTGAGCSTDSGIPDYRDADGEWKRGQPLMFQTFLADARVRQRYWARGMAGWRRITAAQPNRAHLALAELESLGVIHQLVTQNVDTLHQKAGSRNVINLHGRVDVVRCLSCNRQMPRADLHDELERKNPAFTDLDAATAPDGDADLEGVDFSGFDVPDCTACGGLLKPDVVFFGESVPRARLSNAMAAVAESDAMLVVGSSLMVFSGFRFARAMAEAAKPVAAVNIGRTRADEILALKISAPCGFILEQLLHSLRGRAGSA